MKNILNKILKPLLALSIIALPFQNFIAHAEDKSFFEIENLEVTKDEEINMKINLDQISYSIFNFKLTSSSTISNIESNDIALTNSNSNEITFDFDKNESNLSSISLKLKVPDTLSAEDVITFKATITSLENEEETEEIQYKVKITESNTDISDDKENRSENKENDSQKSSETDKNKDSNKKERNESLSTDKTDTKTNKTEGTNSTSLNSSKGSTSNKAEEVVTYNGSDNNYLKELSVTDYSLNKDFIKDRLTYFVTVDSDVTSLEISAGSEDDNASVTINGNSNLKTGTNKILITVTAENGNTKNYRIYVTKK